MKKVQMLPSMITLGNLLCGFAAICLSASFLRNVKPGMSPEQIYSFDASHSRLLELSFALIFLGMIFDVFDGKVARMTNAISEFGAQLDSLADAITFGIAPAFLSVILMQINDGGDNFRKIFFIPSVFMICAILRLARYNVEMNDEKEDVGYFKGLPTPAGAAGLISILWIQYTYNIVGPFIFIAIIIVSSILLGGLEVSNMRYLHIGKKLLKDPKPIIFIPILLTSFFLIFTRPAIAVFVISMGYILASTVVDVTKRIREGRLASAFEEET
ncbi:MAG: hypothetical protein COA79_05455 [Planctomycetota bacterium]|nr:MAG: hypothetical protein COA79_05455 [Planctomycetota bacterium]